ncbi:hypothetical protein [Mucilaginibacter pocheonensis]|uniref:Uncharacterized protein n=1 Tax=Mucilaginibacter pocheonensis TaxID=398050 RepID=A0ABU1TE92_9SPHI|nr:hypothetical protein [Mucilaginibacter pocheonensis]MDR6943735.1 hypothetical protein [Mucilaginibacter pocheonensis]
MYPYLLAFHSATRWLLLLFVIMMIARSFWAFRAKVNYTIYDRILRITATSILHIQLTLGIWLYIVSPVVSYFWHNMATAVHMREIRFFGIEHVGTMMVSMAIFSIGTYKASKQADDQCRFKTQVIWFSIGFLIMLISIPWAFSPLVHRPWIRPLYY